MGSSRGMYLWKTMVVFPPFVIVSTQSKWKGFSTVKIKLKGDGKRYQFRVKSNQYDRHSYIYHFQTTGDWETIEVPLSDMVPKFRGRSLDLSNYPGQVMEEIAFLIGNKRAEAFSLALERIVLD